MDVTFWYYLWCWAIHVARRQVVLHSSSGIDVPLHTGGSRDVSSHRLPARKLAYRPWCRARVLRDVRLALLFALRDVESACIEGARVDRHAWQHLEAPLQCRWNSTSGAVHRAGVIRCASPARCTGVGRIPVDLRTVLGFQQQVMKLDVARRWRRAWTEELTSRNLTNFHLLQWVHIVLRAEQAIFVDIRAIEWIAADDSTRATRWQILAIHGLVHALVDVSWRLARLDLHAAREIHVRTASFVDDLRLIDDTVNMGPPSISGCTLPGVPDLLIACRSYDRVITGQLAAIVMHVHRHRKVEFCVVGRTVAAGIGSPNVWKLA
mmetsp:Transcript_40507/g.96592  ORF Transcript_40507/g.96592 Transcript_40507/m.96592 type:complete len:322 (-) Transcript_40507:142-1107(-)